MKPAYKLWQYGIQENGVAYFVAAEDWSWGVGFVYASQNKFPWVAVPSVLQVVGEVDILFALPNAKVWRLAHFREHEDFPSELWTKLEEQIAKLESSTRPPLPEEFV